MNEPTKEIVKEFWEWCGIKTVNIHCGTRDILGRLADGSHLEVQDSTGKNISVYPPVDLNNLFKYAVPKLERDKDTIMFAHPIDSKKYYCDILDADGEPVSSSLGYSDPALALFWAIYEVMK